MEIDVNNNKVTQSVFTRSRWSLMGQEGPLHTAHTALL